MTGRHKHLGATLTELMIAMAVITIGVMGSMGAFKYINMAMSQARLKTIASNMAQEKMEVLKNKSYFQLLVTTSAETSAGYSPDFVYDTGNYPPEVITLWGMPPLTRSVNVDYAYVSGSSVSTARSMSIDWKRRSARRTRYCCWATASSCFFFVSASDVIAAAERLFAESASRKALA